MYSLRVTPSCPLCVAFGCYTKTYTDTAVPCCLNNPQPSPTSYGMPTPPLGLNAAYLNGFSGLGGYNSLNDLRALSQRVRCEGRGGTWVEDNGCVEYLTLVAPGCTFAAATTACPSNRHLCTMLDLYYGGFRSIDGQGLRVGSGKPYIWVAGYSNAASMYYNWGNGIFSCNSNSAPCYSIRPDSGGAAGAFGCISNTFTEAQASCCINNDGNNPYALTSWKFNRNTLHLPQRPLGVQFNAGTLSNGVTAGLSLNRSVDIKARLDAAACGIRNGRWSDTTGCTEYVTLACPGCTWTAAQVSCPTGRHMCAVLDLYYGGFLSLTLQNLRTSVSSTDPYYIWAQGFQGNNQIYYPWTSTTSGSNYQCTPTSAPMYAIKADQSDIEGAMGCYPQATTGVAQAPCCLDL